MLLPVEPCTRLHSLRERSLGELAVASRYCGRLLSLMEHSAPERSAPGERDDERAEALRRTPVCAPVWAELLITKLKRG